jgi:ABC-type dipeptide/oligopeptide/nickel transport system permease subunit
MPLVLGIGIIGILVLIAIFSPLLTPYTYHSMTYTAILAPPDHSHIFGTDGLGRDIYTRVIYSYRVSLVVAFASIVLALLLGIPIGMIAGYVGGAVDTVISRIIDIMLAFPAILLAISLIAILGQGETVIIIAIGIIYTPILTRVLRASVLDVKNSAYVEGHGRVGPDSSGLWCDTSSRTASVRLWSRVLSLAPSPSKSRLRCPSLALASNRPLHLSATCCRKTASTSRSHPGAPSSPV